MRISIIGSGSIGKELGLKWMNHGHELKFVIGEQEPAHSLDEMLKAFVCEMEEAVAFADTIVLALPFKDCQAIVERIKASTDLSAKLFIDATNSVQTEIPEGFRSAAEALASWLGTDRIVKAFNTTGTSNLRAAGTDDEVPIDVFICGNAKGDKRAVSHLAHEIGFVTIDVGDLATAYQVEMLAELWINLAYRQGMGSNLFFKILHRERDAS